MKYDRFFVLTKLIEGDRASRNHRVAIPNPALQSVAKESHNKRPLGRKQYEMKLTQDCVPVHKSNAAAE
jgi:hypothetical protein